MESTRRFISSYIQTARMDSPEFVDELLDEHTLATLIQQHPHAAYEHQAAVAGLPSFFKSAFNETDPPSIFAPPAPRRRERPEEETSEAPPPFTSAGTSTSGIANTALVAGARALAATHQGQPEPTDPFGGLFPPGEAQHAEGDTPV